MYDLKLGESSVQPSLCHSAQTSRRSRRLDINSYPEDTQNAIADSAFGYALGPAYWGNGYMLEAVHGFRGALV